MYGPPKVPHRSAIYARISQDRDLDRVGVERQVRECLDKAEYLGWEVVDRFIDSDLSAFSGKRRPEYQRLWRAIEDGYIDGLLVWHNDRLHRRIQDLLPFIDLANRMNVQIDTVVGGHYELRTSSGRYNARSMANNAMYESEHKGERVTAASQERAEAGRPNGGSRPFGFEHDQVTIRESEAQVIRMAALRFIAGESLMSLCEDLNKRGWFTAEGHPWRVEALRRTLRRPRNSGQRERYGEIIGDAVWPAIITKDQTAAIMGILDDPARKHTRAPRRYLLAGMLRCHKCGGTLVAQAVGPDKRRYVCKKLAGHINCGGVSIDAVFTETAVTEAVMMRLDNATLAATKAPSIKVPATDDPAALRVRKDENVTMYANGEISKDAYLRADRIITAKLREIDRATAMTMRRTEADTYTQNPGRLRKEWPDLPLSRQQAILRAILDHVVIGPGVRGKDTVREERLQFVWTV